MVVKKMCESASLTQTENQKHFNLIELEMAKTPKFLFSRLPNNVGPYSCKDPESFVREGPTLQLLTFFFVLFFLFIFLFVFS